MTARAAGARPDRPRPQRYRGDRRSREQIGGRYAPALSSADATMTAWLRAGATGVVLVLGACAAQAPSASVTPPAATGLEIVSAGLCDALAALPVESAAARVFTNIAHEPLHRLAADPRLSRTMAARILETMQRVEADIPSSADAATLGRDLAELRSAALAALDSLGIAVPSCAP
jgi:mRNA-degrading endonuclease toxin of MazEF toxin-antitoxin module